ncbi:MAG: hypothetical protein AAB706_01015 [Patescibacteria group bacterium]
MEQNNIVVRRKKRIRRARELNVPISKPYPTRDENKELLKKEERRVTTKIERSARIMPWYGKVTLPFFRTETRKRPKAITILAERRKLLEN